MDDSGGSAAELWHILQAQDMEKVQHWAELRIKWQHRCEIKENVVCLGTFTHLEIVEEETVSFSVDVMEGVRGGQKAIITSTPSISAWGTSWQKLDTSSLNCPDNVDRQNDKLVALLGPLTMEKDKKKLFTKRKKNSLVLFTI